MIKSITALSGVALLGACATLVPIEVPANLKPGASIVFKHVPARCQVRVRLGKDAAPQGDLVHPSRLLDHAAKRSVSTERAYCRPKWTDVGTAQAAR